MNLVKLLNVITISLFFACSYIQAGVQSYVQAGPVRLWCETFGEKQNPAFLLIMGGNSQGIMWPTAFCEKLAQRGYYVIRYDHRDIGKSTSCNFLKNPYTLRDLADDATYLLDALEIQQAHVAGISMGGSIALLLGAYHPARLLSITAIGATTDLRTVLEPEERAYILPIPNEKFLSWVRATVTLAKQNPTKEQIIANYLEGWRVSNGNDETFDEPLYRDLVIESVQRQGNPQGLANQVLAMKASHEQMQEVFAQVKMHVSILHGTNDPIFHPSHAYHLASLLPSAKVSIIVGMGHNITAYFYDNLIDALVEQAQSPPMTSL